MSEEALAGRVRAEFAELRGVLLSLPQAARLFGIPQPLCTRILERLLAEGFIRRTSGDRYGLNAAVP